MRDVDVGEFGDGYPSGAADFFELCGDGTVAGAEDVDVVDVAVWPDLAVGDVHFEDGVRGGVCGDGWMVEQWVGDDVGVDAGFFGDLADGGLGWILVGIDVPTRIQPSAQLVVVDEQDLVVVVEDDR